MKNIYKKLFVLIFLIAGFSTFNVQAQRPIHEIHSMLIFNFIKYIEWPEEVTSGEFTIAVYGDEDVFNQLNEFYGKRSVKGQKSNIVKIEDPASIPSAHVIYIASNKSRDFEDILSKFDAKPTLIITDRAGLGEKGSSINFKVVDGKLKFEINQATFDNSNLKISSQLVNMGIAI
ncbi:YfiR family protein [Marivirga sp.]|uniref:YfiR family protein n=1 Tax=Marivirga sp. TaxID=2018662 RepID=UPI002D7EE885|nr:YfiR family protein [Marivirga sp.]HET8861541.1 YfiR family protein [Marivirga sp.]